MHRRHEHKATFKMTQGGQKGNNITKVLERHSTLKNYHSIFISIFTSKCFENAKTVTLGV